MDAGKSLIAVIPFGDSLTANMSTTPTRDWYSFANTAIGSPTRVVRNAGVGGNRTDQTLARVSTDVLAYRPELVVVYVGLNDVYQGIATATITANLAAIYDALNAAGIPFIACVLGPHTATTQAQADVHRAVNAWIRTNVAATWDALVCDWSNSLTTGDETTAISGIIEDTVHFSENGARVAGAAFAPTLAAALAAFA